MGDNRIYYPQSPLIAPNKPSSPSQNSYQAPRSGGPQFGQVLKEQLAGVKFSQHAQQRLETRKINLDETALSKLNAAVDKAANKGAKESLILMNNLALVVSVTNRTVITAMDGASIKENVFTNIDSAVIL